MSASVETVVVPVGAERTAILEALRRLGASEDEARAQAHVWVEADLCGRASHGVQRLPTLAARVRGGLVRPQAPLDTNWVTPAVLVVDGNHGFGPHALERSLEIVSRCASERTGVTLVALRHASHLGMLSPYLERIAAQGLIGLLATTSEALVHPIGGVTKLLGTNPIGIAIPAEPDAPFVLDMATGAISMGQVMAYEACGARLPAGVAIDALGRPTTDPTEAQTGAITPFGGGKGYGLALALELLVACLTQTALGVDVLGTLDRESLVTKGDIAIVIDPRQIGGGSSTTAIGRYLQLLRASIPAPGSSGVRIPGDRARAERGKRQRDGIPLPLALWREVSELADGEPGRELCLKSA